MKSSVISVIQDRGSLVGSQRQHQRQMGGPPAARGQRSSLLRQVTDVKLKGSSSTPRNVSIREKELCSTNGSSSSQSDKQEVDVSLMPLLPAEIDHVEETPPASIFVIEVDVNHIDSVHENMDEEVMENKDKG